MIIREKFQELEPGSQIKAPYRNHDVHFVKVNSYDRCAVIFYKEDIPDSASKSFHGFELLAEPAHNRYVIQMSSEGSNLTIFSSLVEFMLERLSVMTEVNFKKLLELSEEWRDFGKLESTTIDIQKQIGLFGEMLFIEEMVTSYKFEAVIKGWLGPEKNKVDFVLSNDLALEIKASRDPLKNDVSISSLEQLSDGFSKHYLRRYGLAETPNGRNLHDLYLGISSSLENFALRDEFRSKSMSAGYNPYLEYQDLRDFSVVKIQDYDVINEEFPKIHGPVHDKITRLSYTINLNGIQALGENEFLEIIKPVIP